MADEKAGKTPAELIDARIEELGDWRGKMLARIRKVVKQADLVPSIQQWLGGPVTLGPYNASLFEPPRENVALHRRGTELGLLDVFWPEGDGQIRMAGDDTAFIVQHNLSEDRQQETLALIANERWRPYHSSGRP